MKITVDGAEYDVEECDIGEFWYDMYARTMTMGRCSDVFLTPQYSVEALLFRSADVSYYLLRPARWQTGKYLDPPACMRIRNG